MPTPRIASCHAVTNLLAGYTRTPLPLRQWRDVQPGHGALDTGKVP